MGTRKTVIVLILAGVIPLSAACGSSDFPYCDVPLALPEDPQAAEMTLTQLQVVIRHGDRTPTAKLPTGTVPWECEPFAHTLRFLDVSPQAVNQETTGPFEFPPSCVEGQLTVQGRDQQLALGAAMRQKYVESLGFLPAALTPSNRGQLFFRSTDYSRTRQSGQAFLVGLYPAPYRIGNPTLTLHIRDLYNMRPNGTLCPKINTIGAEFQKSEVFAQIVEKHLPAVRSVGLKIGTWKAGTDAKVGSMQELASYWATLGASDNLYGRVCHDKQLPEGIGVKDVSAMRAAMDETMAAGYTFDRPKTESARLQMGSFLGDIQEAMQGAAQGGAAPRMALYGAHDLTLWGLLATLSQDNNVQIPFASHMAFELWKDPQGESWVAVDFNGSYLTVGDCPGSFCRLTDFEAAIEKFVPVDYEKECQVTAP